jgi:hypothetical protein
MVEHADADGTLMVTGSSRVIRIRARKCTGTTVTLFHKAGNNVIAAGK